MHFIAIGGFLFAITALFDVVTSFGMLGWLSISPFVGAVVLRLYHTGINDADLLSFNDELFSSQFCIKSI